MKKLKRILSLAVAWLFVNVAHGQAVPELLLERVPENRPTLLVVASPHFGNPGQDNINIDVDDVLSASRQAEIQALADILQKYKPTHIALEVLYSNQDRLDSHYQDYREGTADLNRTEADQIGLRLANMLEHDQVYAVDWQGAPPGGFTDDYNWYEHGQGNGQEDRVSALSNPDVVGDYMRQGQRSIPEWLLDINSEDGLIAFHRLYFDVALIGNEESSPGANWVGHWFTRNLMIFNNIVRLAENRDDRVLVIYGASHAYPLRQFAIESGAFTVVDLGDFFQ